MRRDCLQAMPCKEEENKRSAVKNLFHSIVIAKSTAQSRIQYPQMFHCVQHDILLPSVILRSPANHVILRSFCHSERSEESVPQHRHCERVERACNSSHSVFRFPRPLLQKQKVVPNLFFDTTFLMKLAAPTICGVRAAGQSPADAGVLRNAAGTWISCRWTSWRHWQP